MIFAYMDINEAITQITSMVKPYVGIMQQSTFSNNIKAIKHGLAKPATIEKFMAKFGYSKVKQVEQWEKK